MAVRAGSFLNQVIRKIRSTVKDPETNAEYPNEDLHLDYITPSYNVVTQDVTRASGAKSPVMHLEIALTDGTRSYDLPPHIQKIVGLGRFDSGGRFRWVQNVPGHQPLLGKAGGPLYRVEGGRLIFRPFPEDWDSWFRDSKVDVLYKPGSFQATHEGAGAVNDATTFTLAASPTFGSLSGFTNAYAGFILRLKDSDYATSFDRRILTYNPSTRQVTLDHDLPAGAVSHGTFDYEVLPPFGDEGWNACALYCAAEIMAARNAASRFDRTMQLFRDQIGFLRQGALMLEGPNHSFERTVFSGDATTRAMSPNRCFYEVPV